MKTNFYIIKSASYEAYLAFIVKLTRQLYQRNQRVTILASQQLITKLDEQLWTDGDYDFIPHRHYVSGDASTWLRLPIVLLEDLSITQRDPDVLINLTDSAINDPKGYQTIVEIVYQDESALVLNRDKYRAYKMQGLEIGTFEI